MNTMTSRYRALRCDALSSDLSGLHFVELDAQAPGPGEVAVRMRAAALNFPDLLMTRGGYQHKPDLPYVVGMEGAGVIEAVGAGVESWRVGDGVCFSNLTGSFAERNIVPADKLSGRLLARASPTNSCTVLAGTDGWTTITKPMLLIRLIGAKLFSGS